MTEDGGVTRWLGNWYLLKSFSNKPSAENYVNQQREKDRSKGVHWRYDYRIDEIEVEED